MQLYIIFHMHTLSLTQSQTPKITNFHYFYWLP